MTADEKTGDKRYDNGGCDPKGTCEEEASVPLPESIEPQKQVSENPLDSSKEANKDEAEEESMGSTDKEEENDSGQSSPRGVLENNPVVGGSDSDSTTSSSGTVAVGGVSESAHGTQWRNVICNFLQRKKQPMRRLSTFPPGEVRRKGLMRRFGSMRPSRDVVEEDHLCPSVVVMGKPSWRNFDYKELQDATDYFSSERLIGKGGHAEVYKGSLPDGELVAVKRLMKKDSEEGKISDFLSELGIIAHVNHPNAARLLGFSLHGGLHLVLKFTPHGSLASVLHGSSKEKLEWGTRFKIALGVAEGLLYLHKGCHRRIIHRDIKASNILLTEDYQPQISDFGLAKWLPDQLTHHVVFPIEGTFGYLAPEYFMHGVVSEKTDVFAFGVLLLELVTGRRAVDSCRQSLVMWAKPLLDAKEVSKLVDPLLGDSYDSEEMNWSVTVAAMCINHLSTNRPQMKQVVEILKGEDGSASPTRKEVKLSGGKPPVSDAACEMEDYTCSTYLNDLNRYKQLVLNGE